MDFVRVLSLWALIVGSLLAALPLDPKRLIQFPVTPIGSLYHDQK
ncbi:MAG TPA: hypothetical protein VFH99_00925 [Candidatus Saccharimonadales bacterium]|nr:hypothetical protein [Candidatus Saccharimonadales bacterium]